MKGITEHLVNRIYEVIQETGGFINDHAIDLIAELVDTVVSDPRSENHFEYNDFDK